MENDKRNQLVSIFHCLANFIMINMNWRSVDHHDRLQWVWTSMVIEGGSMDAGWGLGKDWLTWVNYIYYLFIYRGRVVGNNNSLLILRLWLVLVLVLRWGQYVPYRGGSGKQGQVILCTRTIPVNRLKGYSVDIEVRSCGFDLQFFWGRKKAC